MASNHRPWRKARRWRRTSLWAALLGLAGVAAELVAKVA